MIIAIDGPAASGKGTLGKLIAEHFGFAHLDTGLLYRAVARDVLARGAALDDEQVAVECARSLDPETLSDPTLRQLWLASSGSERRCWTFSASSRGASLEPCSTGGISAPWYVPTRMSKYS